MADSQSVCFPVEEQMRLKYFEKIANEWITIQTGMANSPEGYARKTLTM